MKETLITKKKYNEVFFLQIFQSQYLVFLMSNLSMWRKFA